MDFYTALDYLDENEGSAIKEAGGMVLSRRVPDIDDGDGLSDKVCLCQLIGDHWVRTMPSGAMFRADWDKSDLALKK